MGFIYKHDACGLHQAKSAAAFIDGEKVEVLPWAAQSLNLNLIEDVWALMKFKLRLLITYPSKAMHYF